MTTVRAETPVSTPRLDPAQESRDLGFGSVVSNESRTRLLNRDGTFNVARRGLRFFDTLAPYHTLLMMSWPKFLGLSAAFYSLINLAFGVVFYLLGADTLHASDGTDLVLVGRFWESVFFSIQTFATIGYGHVAPAGFASNFVVAFESLVGIMSQAMITGLLFARFARPSANILYSRNAVVAPYRGMSAFMFRITNHRSNELIDLQARILFSRMVERDGRRVRSFDPLSLEREKVVFFPLAWTIVHPITESSPLFGLTERDLEASEAEFLVLLSGTDETFSATVHSRSSYRFDEIVWNARFTDVFRREREAMGQGGLSIDIDRIHEYERL